MSSEKEIRIILRELKKLFPDVRPFLNHSSPWELLVGVILSAQCTDKKVNEVTAKLFKKYPRLEDYLAARPEEFEKDIFQTGFYKAKTKHILTTARMIHEKFGGKVPQTMEEILTLRGVARKTANVVLSNAYGIAAGIAVDTHVMRLARKFGLSNGKNPVQIERDLMKIIPRDEWLHFTHRIIQYGRAYCPARAHDHENEPLVKALRKADRPR